MIDYKKKFKDLNNKISGIIDENKKDNNRINKYISKLEDIEKKTIKRFNYLDKSFINLKEYFIKLSNQYHLNLKNEKVNNFEKTINDI